MSDNQNSHNAGFARRGFVGRMIAGAAGLLAVRPAAHVLAAETIIGPGDDWMKSLTAPHRTVLDCAAHKDGKPLGWHRLLGRPESEYGRLRRRDRAQGRGGRRRRVLVLAIL